MAYTSNTHRLKNVHLRYLQQTGRKPPYSITDSDAAELYVEWLEDELEKQYKSEEEIINMRTIDEKD